MAVYYKNKDELGNQKSAISKTAKETGFAEKEIEEKLVQEQNFRYPILMNEVVTIEGDKDDESYTKQYGDSSSNPEYLYAKTTFYNMLHNALDTLDPEDRYKLLASNKICYKCFSIIPQNDKKYYTQIANEFFMVSESTIQKANRKSETKG